MKYLLFILITIFFNVHSHALTVDDIIGEYTGYVDKFSENHYLNYEHYEDGAPYASNDSCNVSITSNGSLISFMIERVRKKEIIKTLSIPKISITKLNKILKKESTSFSLWMTYPFNVLKSNKIIIKASFEKPYHHSLVPESSRNPFMKLKSDKTKGAFSNFLRSLNISSESEKRPCIKSFNLNCGFDGSAYSGNCNITKKLL